MYISHADWSLTLDLKGGRVVQLEFKKQRILGTYTRLDGKSGTTHICAPAFDREGMDRYGLPFHGYARTLDWTVSYTSPKRIEISTSTPASTEYNAALKITQRFTLDDTFTHLVSVTNQGGSAVPVNIGIHYYWDTPQGWANTTLNSKSQESAIMTNGSAELTHTNTIVFPHVTYQFESRGFRSAALWTSFAADTTGHKTYNQDFCCIEPIIGWPGYFGSPNSFLEPNTSISASIELKKVV